MEFEKVIKERQSCRNYDSTKKVEKSKIDQIMKDAMLAPSACNSQPYSFVVVNGEKSATVAECAQQYGGNKFTDKCPAFIVIVEEKANLIARVGAIVKSQAFAENDIGIVASYITLSATNQGLSTCIMGLFNEKRLKKELGIDDKKRIRLVIALGYADSADVLREKKRKELSAMYEYID